MKASEKAKVEDLKVKNMRMKIEDQKVKLENQNFTKVIKEKNR
jgi:hypothetical protein